MFRLSRRPKSARIATRQNGASCRPRLEVLEDRTVPAGFVDGFEGPTLDPFWTKTQISGFVTMPSTERVHTGTQSVKFTSTNSGVDKNVGLGHNFGTPVYGKVSVWLFDTAAGDASSNQFWFFISNSATGKGPLLAAADYNELKTGTNSRSTRHRLS
jgi:hypothetical protein